MAFLYLENKTFINAHLLKAGMMEIERIYSLSQKEYTINKIVKNLDKYKTDYDVSSLIKSSPNFQVDIIPGDTKLSLSEDFLSKDWTDVITGTHRGIQTNLVFKDLLNKLRDNYEFEIYIIYDPKNNHEELTKSFTDLVQKVDIKRTELASTMSW